MNQEDEIAWMPPRLATKVAVRDVWLTHVCDKAVMLTYQQRRDLDPDGTGRCRFCGNSLPTGAPW